MIFCNGIPKSGTHLLVDFLFFLKFKRIAKSLIYRDELNGFKLLTKKKNLSKDSIFKLYDNYFIHSHIISNEISFRLVNNHKMIFIKRNPKNIIISWFRRMCERKKNFEKTKDNLAFIITNGMFGQGSVHFMNKFVNWIDNNKILIVEFEKLSNRHFNEYQKITSYLGLNFLDKDFQNFELNKSPTSNQIKSNWKEFELWTPEIEKLWNDHGGNKIQQYLGYDLND